jgi:anti-sigma factor RsiW
MKEDTSLLPGEAELHAYVDGRLDATRRAAVESRLASDADAAQRVQDWIAQRDSLRTLHADVLGEGIPEHLLHAADLLQQRNRRLASWQRWGGMAASVLLAFILGWGSHMQWQSGGFGLTARQTTAFAHQAAVAHAVYTPEVRHPVEVDATQQQHLVQWLSKRLNHPLKVPNLTSAGYELVGGRLLPGDGGARAQFMYQNSAGERVTLYLGAIDGAKQKGMEGTAFRFADEGGISTFYWVDEGFGCALSGKLPRQTMLQLSEIVYKQL